MIVSIPASCAERIPFREYVTKSYYHGYLLPIDGPDSPQLYDMNVDDSESYSAADRNPEALAMVKHLMADARAKFDPLKATQQPFDIAAIMAALATNGPKQD
jgi:hypothetical protein